MKFIYLILSLTVAPFAIADDIEFTKTISPGKRIEVLRKEIAFQQSLTDEQMKRIRAAGGEIIIPDHVFQLTYVLTTTNEPTSLILWTTKYDQGTKIIGGGGYKTLDVKIEEEAVIVLNNRGGFLSIDVVTTKLPTTQTFLKNDRSILKLPGDFQFPVVGEIRGRISEDSLSVSLKDGFKRTYEFEFIKTPRGYRWIEKNRK